MYTTTNTYIYIYIYIQFLIMYIYICTIYNNMFVTVSLSWKLKLVLGLSHDTVDSSWLTSARLFLTDWLFGSQGHEKKAPFSKTFLRPLGH